MALNFCFDCMIRLCLIVNSIHKKFISAQESFYLQGILNDINEQDTPFLDCKHRHLMKCEGPPDKVPSHTICLPIEFHGFTSRINSKGYHCLVPGLISIFLETVWVPLKNVINVHICNVVSLALQENKTTELANKFKITSLSINLILQSFATTPSGLLGNPKKQKNVLTCTSGKDDGGQETVQKDMRLSVMKKSLPLQLQANHL